MRGAQGHGDFGGVDTTLRWGVSEGAFMDEMAFALDFEMPGHKQSELGGSRNTTSKKRERTGLKAQEPKPKECSGHHSIPFSKHH